MHDDAVGIYAPNLKQPFSQIDVLNRFIKRRPHRSGYLFFAHPKKRHEKKGCPNSPPYGCSVLLAETGAAQLALCSALIALKHVLAIIPFRLRCSTENNGFTPPP